MNEWSNPLKPRFFTTTYYPTADESGLFSVVKIDFIHLFALILMQIVAFSNKINMLRIIIYVVKLIVRVCYDISNLFINYKYIGISRYCDVLVCFENIYYWYVFPLLFICYFVTIKIARHPGSSSDLGPQIYWSVLGMQCMPSSVNVDETILSPDGTVTVYNISALLNVGEHNINNISIKVQ